MLTTLEKDNLSREISVLKMMGIWEKQCVCVLVLLPLVSVVWFHFFSSPFLFSLFFSLHSFSLFLLSLPPSLPPFLPQPVEQDLINNNPMIQQIKEEYIKKKEELEGVFSNSAKLLHYFLSTGLDCLCKIL